MKSTTQICNFIRNKKFNSVISHINQENINGYEKTGKTPIQIAAMWGDKNILIYLYWSGADINKKSKDGKDILEFTLCEDVKRIINNWRDGSGKVSKTIHPVEDSKEGVVG